MKRRGVPVAAAVFGLALEVALTGAARAADATRTLPPGKRLDVVLATTSGTSDAWELSPTPPATVVER